jgi:hypothetical protein
MGVFRGGLLVLVSIMLFLGILVQGFFLTVYLSLEHDVVSPQITSIAKDLFEKQELPSEFNSSLVEEQISNMVEEKYYGSYDCNFFDCIQKTGEPFSLVSKHAQDYWKIKFFYFLIVLFLLLGGVFLLVENKSNFFILSSVLFIVASFVFLKLKLITELLLVPFLKMGDQSGDFSLSLFFNLFSVFLVKSPFVFKVFLGIGILLLIVGVIIKSLGIGFELSGFIERVSGWFKKKETSPTIGSQIGEEKRFVFKVKSSKKTIKKSATKKKRL